MIYALVIKKQSKKTKTSIINESSTLELVLDKPTFMIQAVAELLTFHMQECWVFGKPNQKMTHTNLVLQ